MKKFLSIIFIIAFTHSFAQETIDSAEVKKLQSYEFSGVFRSAVSANFGGIAGIIGVSYDFFMSEHWGFEIGGGYPGAGFGFRYYPYKIERSKGKFYIAQRNVIFGKSLGKETKMQYGLCFGVTHFGTNRMNYSLDLGPMYEHTVDTFDYISPENGPFNIMFNFKVGYRFSFKYMKRKRELEAKK